MLLEHLYCGMQEPELKIINVFVCKLRKNSLRRPAETIILEWSGVVALAVQQAWEAALGLGAGPPT